MRRCSSLRVLQLWFSHSCERQRPGLSVRFRSWALGKYILQETRKNLALNKQTDLHIPFMEVTCTSTFGLLLSQILIFWISREEDFTPSLSGVFQSLPPTQWRSSSLRSGKNFLCSSQTVLKSYYLVIYFSLWKVSDTGESLTPERSTWLQAIEHLGNCNLPQWVLLLGGAQTQTQVKKSYQALLSIPYHYNQENFKISIAMACNIFYYQ